MTKGKIVKISSFISAFNDVGDMHELSPGDSVLVLDSDIYDTTFLSYGIILYCHTRRLEESIQR